MHSLVLFLLHIYKKSNKTILIKNTSHGKLNWKAKVFLVTDANAKRFQHPPELFNSSDKIVWWKICNSTIYSVWVKKEQLSVSSLALSVAGVHGNQAFSRIRAPQRSAVSAWPGAEKASALHTRYIALWLHSFTSW